MALSERERGVIAALQAGLPLVSRPYAAIAERLGLSEAQVLHTVEDLRARGTIKRLGLVVRHHELGYRANAMVVWDLPEAVVAESAPILAAAEAVTLCYQRPRRPPQWPYNLFCMVHGRRREAVLAIVDELTTQAGLAGYPRAILFSRRRFKQRGARYLREAG